MTTKRMIDPESQKHPQNLLKIGNKAVPIVLKSRHLFAALAQRKPRPCTKDATFHFVASNLLSISMRAHWGAKSAGHGGDHANRASWDAGLDVRESAEYFAQPRDGLGDDPILTHRNI